jgi:ubiquinone/menaquinone biosynthesis C-methylase UbiE/uncharacterized protein YbaR (Trm112 family)
MNPRSLALLCDPDTHAPLELNGDALVNPETGTPFPVREGIPIFLGDVEGLNRKYQTMYDRLAPGYDIAERLYTWILRKPDFRLEYIGELEVPPGARVLEVSVGTGGNLRHLRLDAEIFGLDLSWGMLHRCVRNLRKWRRAAELFQGEAERLPFRDAVFDCVFHVGGINFFNDKSRAIEEMIRVARPGTKLVIIDETDKVISGMYSKNPLTRKYYQGTEGAAFCPVGLVPPAMNEVQSRLIVGGRMYCLTFRKP